MAPFSVSEDTMITAVGRSVINMDRAVSPSISGMFTSRVMTSGLNSRCCIKASTPLRAVAISKSPSSANIETRCFLISAESSTINRRVLAAINMRTPQLNTGSSKVCAAWSSWQFSDISSGVSNSTDCLLLACSDLHSALLNKACGSISRIMRLVSVRLAT